MFWRCGLTAAQHSSQVLIFQGKSCSHFRSFTTYLWRNVMPACRGLGRLIACDMIGMGESEKLPDSGPDRYTYVEQRSFLFALWKQLGVDKDVVFVLHDWGSLLG